MTKRQAKKVLTKRWLGRSTGLFGYRQGTVDRAHLKLGGFVVDGIVIDECRLMELRGQRWETRQ